MLSNILNGINDFLWGKPFTYFVLFIGLYFTVRSGFFSLQTYIEKYIWKYV